VYKIDLSREYGVSCTFNIADLKPCFKDGKHENLRKNSFLEGEDNVLMEDQHDQCKESLTSQEIKSTRLLIQELLSGYFLV